MSLQQEPPDGDDDRDADLTDPESDDPAVEPINAEKGPGLWGRIRSLLGMKTGPEDS